MKRTLHIGLLSIFFLSIVAGAQAASVSWDVAAGAAGSYSIPLGGNAAIFVYNPPFSVDYTQQNNGDVSSFSLNTPVSNTATTDFGPTNASDGMQFYAMGGGATHAEGVVNQAVAQINVDNYTGNQYVNAGKQQIQTLVSRSFSATPGADVTVDAEISGIIDWFNLNWNWSDGTPGSITGPIDPASPYSAYKIYAEVTLLPASLSGSVVADIPDPIYLDEDNLIGSTSFIADADPDTYYLLQAVLNIDTRVQNFSFTTGPSGTLPDVGNIGSQGDPLLMTTTVNQNAVPIPGSIVLLFSGIIGLFSLRKKR